MKKFIAILIVLCISTALLAACTPATSYEAAMTMKEYLGNYDEPTITDYTVAEGFDIARIRLEVYNGSGWEPADENSSFDPNKPTFIFAHGLGPDLHGRYPEAMYAKGYNVLNFLWGAFSGNKVGVNNVGFLIWDKIDRYEINTEEEYALVMAEGFNCTVPELYLARYCDFFKNYPTYSQPIIMTGHSYGGQLTCAMSGLMTKCLNEHKLNPCIYPDKFMLIDPYFDNHNFTYECAWFGETFHGSSIAAGSAILDYDIENNTPIEILRTSSYVKMATHWGDVEKPKADVFYTSDIEMKVLYLELKDSETICPGINADDIARLHSIAEDFTLTVYREEPYEKGDVLLVGAKDVYTDEYGNVLYGKFAPASYSLAARGIHMDVTTNGSDYNRYDEWTITPTYYDPDYVNQLLPLSEADEAYLTYSWCTEDFSKIAGFVNADENKNGKYDDGASSRLNNVTVILKDTSGKVLQTIKTNRGYYEFKVEKDKDYVVEIHTSNYTDKSANVRSDGIVNIVDFLTTKK